MTAARLNARWRTLVGEFLPIRVEGTAWCASRLPGAHDPTQGWKLHVSATTISACEVLSAAAPLLAGKRTLFKAPATLATLQELNSGLVHGYSQVGKFITVYPRSESEAVELAGELHRLTLGLAAPRVPYDMPFAPGSCVHYRFGSFVGTTDGASQPILRTPQGENIPDDRGPGRAVPPWAADPFVAANRQTRRRRPTALAATYRAYETIWQRGRGGLYRALDLGVAPARLCVLKEGRRHGEVDWEGRDGYHRARREASALRQLGAAGVAVPEVYGTFVAGGNFYVAMETLEGSNLAELVGNGLSPGQPRELAIGLAELLAQIHAAGWVWNDCKPLNVIVATDGRLRPLDFEGAARIGGHAASTWGSEAYLPPQVRPQRGHADPEQAAEAEDLYALGVSIWQLHNGRLPASQEELRDQSRLPAPAREVVRLLVSARGAGISAAAAVHLLRARLSRTNA